MANSNTDTHGAAAYIAEVLADYEIAYKSRQASLTGRKEVLTGKAKFGIFGDGKEVAQVAMAKVFEKGDFRAGYYRDQTFMFAKGISDIRAFFAQLYAHTDVNAEPASGGRSMNGHFATRLLDENGNWLSQSDRYNSAADISPTAGQMPKLVGLAMASKVYRNNPELHADTKFSNKGNEIAFGTIGNASTSEGLFWEAINACGVMQVPLLMSIWDDEYGISVPAKYQTTKENLSALLSGFVSEGDKKGIELFSVKGWDYAALCLTYKQAADLCRQTHTPVVVHVTEVTQPQGHSTSGSHERYKSKERLAWEQEYDCIAQFRLWIEGKGLASATDLDEMEARWKKEVADEKKAAWDAYLNEIKAERHEMLSYLTPLAQVSSESARIEEASKDLLSISEPVRKDISSTMDKALRITIGQHSAERENLIRFRAKYQDENTARYSSHIYSQSPDAALQVSAIAPQFASDAPLVDGREVMRACFEAALKRDPRVFAFGEDLGKIGDVNQGFAGLQDEFGELRVGDRGIREATIVGEGIGAAIRGLRPIAEIQYLDYLLYALQIMSDDIATMQYRTRGGQKVPLIIRTRGHRLEGIWHSGSPMGMIINAVRGMHVLVPRNMTQAAGFYNTMLASDEPALIIECLNGYRLKEKMPANIGEMRVPLGVPELLLEGSDVTLVSYGSTLRIAEEACKQLQESGISVELIDVQSLLPFDIHHRIVQSLKKTNRIVFLDEDVPGGATAFMMQKVLEEQGGYRYLDSAPLTITSKEHRPAYGTDGDYFSKPNVEEIFEAIYNLMRESDPGRFPVFI